MSFQLLVIYSPSTLPSPFFIPVYPFPVWLLYPLLSLPLLPFFFSLPPPPHPLTSFHILYVVVYYIFSRSLPSVKWSFSDSPSYSLGFCVSHSGSVPDWSVDPWPVLSGIRTPSLGTQNHIPPHATGLRIPGWGMGLLVTSTWLFLEDTPSHHCPAPSFQQTLAILQFNKTQCPLHPAQPCPVLRNVFTFHTQ